MSRETIGFLIGVGFSIFIAVIINHNKEKSKVECSLNDENRIVIKFNMKNPNDDYQIKGVKIEREIP